MILRGSVPALSGTSDAGSAENPVFLADLHLWPLRPRGCLRFASFLKNEAKRFDALFLLGDIFEYWLGDDAMGPGRLAARALARHARAGHRVYVMQGNRDFALGEAFARAAGAVLLAPQAVVTVRGRRILLSHGDEWCTLDSDYQEFRSLVRSPEWQKQALSLSAFKRLLTAARLRGKSKTAKREKTPEMMDVVPSAVAADAAKWNCSAVIHGHTHRPAEHLDEAVPRFVVPNWEIDGAAAPRWGWAECRENGMPRVIIRRP